MQSKDTSIYINTDDNESHTVDNDHDKDEVSPFKLNRTRNRRIILVGVSLLFICLIILVGTLVVCLTEPKKNNQTCQMSFKRITKRTTEKDTSPQHVVTGFLNEDYFLDLVVANSGTDTIGIFLSDGNASFLDPISYYVAQNCQPHSVAIGYFNNDSVADIAVACRQTNNIAIFISNGNASLLPPTFISLGQSKPLSIRLIYWNKDNYGDLVVSTDGTALIIVLLSKGDGSFVTSSTFHMGYDAYPGFLTVEDVNDDSQDDIIVINNGINNLVVLLSNGNGSATRIEKWWQESGFIGSSISIGYVNQDYRKDIVVGSSFSNEICIFFGNENGTFDRMIIQRILEEGMNTNLIALQKLDKDFITDLTVVDTRTGRLVVLKGVGNGTFDISLIMKNQYCVGASWMLSSAFDRNALPAIVVLDSETNNIFIGFLYNAYISGDLQSYFLPKQSMPSALGIGDFNSDYVTDIVFANSGNNSISVLLRSRDENASVTVECIKYNNSIVQAIATGDINNDNHLDIVIAFTSNSAITIVLGNGDGTFREPINYYVSEYSMFYDIALSYLNNDTYLDIVVCDYQYDNIGVMLGRGDGTFHNMTRYNLGSSASPVSIAVYNMNADLNQDIVTANYYTSSVSILYGSSNGTFSESVNYNVDRLYPRSVHVAHMNSDSYPDIIVVDPIYGQLVIFYSDSNGHYNNFLYWHLDSSMYPYVLNVADYNQDGFQDVAVLHRNTDNIIVYLGDENASFPFSITFDLEESSSASYMLTGDLNDDTFPDLIVNNYGYDGIDMIYIRSEVDFIRRKAYSTGVASHPTSIQLDHWDNDTILDIFVANAGSNNIEIRRSSDNQRMYYSTDDESRPSSLVTGDFDHDNFEDVAVVNTWKSDVHVFFGSGRRTAVLSTGDGSFPVSITKGYINDDDRLDIIVANSVTDSIGIFLGWDTVIFDTFDMYLDDISSKPFITVVQDFNNDSYLDLAVAKDDSNQISILYNSHSQTSGKENILYTNNVVRSMTYADVSGDGRGDLIVTTYFVDYVEIFLCNVNGTFDEESLKIPSGCSTTKSVAVGDFNGDHITDLVVSDSNYGTIAILLGFGNGSFADPRLSSFFDGTDIYADIKIAVADFNQDGRTDVAVVTTTATQLAIGLAGADGSIENWVLSEILTPFEANHLAVGDLNNDSLVDVVLTSPVMDGVRIFFGDGHGQFNHYIFLPSDSNGLPSSIIIWDMNNDRIMDILISVSNTNVPGIYIYYGFGQGNFTELQFYSTEMKSQPLSITIADLNQDNRPDIVVANGAGGHIFLMMQNHLIPFTQMIEFNTGAPSNPIAVAVADLDSDHKSDLIVINEVNNTVGVAFGLGNGHFQPFETYPTGNSTKISSMVTHDIDNDNHTDLILVYSGTDQIAIWLGNGRGGWKDIRFCSLNYGSAPKSVAIVDWNNSSQYDLVVATFGSSAVLVLEYRNGTCVNPSSAPSYSLDYDSDPRSIAVGDIDGDQAMDIVVASYGTNLIDIFLQTCKYDTIIN